MNEEGADKLRAEGAEANQIVARARALVSGAPPYGSGQPTNKAAVDWRMMGAEKGTRGMTWEQIEEGADNLRASCGTSTADAHSTPAHDRTPLQARTDDRGKKGSQKGEKRRHHDPILQRAHDVIIQEASNSATLLGSLTAVSKDVQQFKFVSPLQNV